jgi:hypothetical protein
MPRFVDRAVTDTRDRANGSRGGGRAKIGAPGTAAEALDTPVRAPDGVVAEREGAVAELGGAAAEPDGARLEAGISKPGADPSETILSIRGPNR